MALYYLQMSVYCPCKQEEVTMTTTVKETVEYINPSDQWIFNSSKDASMISWMRNTTMVSLII